MNLQHIDLAIIGAGPVGLFCIFQAGMFGMSSVVIDALPQIGGQCSALYPDKPIYDIPGHPHILAHQLVEQLEVQAAPFAPTYLLAQQVTTLIPQPNGIEIETTAGSKMLAGCIIIAAGGGMLRPKRLPGIEESKSIFYSVQNIEQFRDRTVVIAGGGDSAVDWALLLYKIARKVYLVHRRPKFRAAAHSVAQLLTLAQSKERMEVVTPYQLHGIKQQDGLLQAVQVADLDGAVRTIEADILVPCFGLENDLGPIEQWGVELEQKHIVVQPHSMQTNLPRVYAIGDVAIYPGKLKLILTGFAEAALACNHARGVLHPDQAWHFEYSTTKGIPTVHS